MEFEKVRGQIESLWNEGLTEAGARARRSGEAAGVERVFQAGEAYAAELATWEERPRPADFLAELRRRLSLPEPEVLEERLTFAEWEARHAEQPGVERLTFAEWEERAKLAGWVHALDKGPELPPTDEFIEVDEQGLVHGAVIGPLREGPDMRPGFRVGDVAEPLVRREGDEERRVLVDRRGGEAPLPEVARGFEVEELDARVRAAAVQADMAADQERERSAL